MDNQNEIQKFIDELQALESSSSISGVLQYGKMLRIKNYSGNMVNLLLVFKSVSLETLKELNQLLAKNRSIRIEPFILTENEIESASDVYPIKFLDISQNHKLLFGKDPFEKLEIAKDNLRLRCEQELRNIALRLRYTLAKGDGGLMKARKELKNSFYSLINNLEVVLMLTTHKTFEDYDQIMDHAIQDLHLDKETLYNIHFWVNDERNFSDDEFLKIYQSYRDEVDGLIHLIDKH